MRVQKKILFSSTGFVRQRYFFLVLACHYIVLDGFDQHYQASVHFPLTINKFQQHQNKFSGMLRIKPRATGWEARMPSLGYVAPSLSEKKKRLGLGWSIWRNFPWVEMCSCYSTTNRVAPQVSLDWPLPRGHHSWLDLQGIGLVYFLKSIELHRIQFNADCLIDKITSPITLGSTAVDFNSHCDDK